MEIKELLKNLRTTVNKWGEELEPPATNLDISKIIADVGSTYSIKLPDEYIEFLESTNGLEFNGFIIYGTKNSELDPDAFPLDLMEMNEVLGDSILNDFQNIIVLGESSTGIITYDSTLKKVQYRDRIGLHRVDLYPSFKAMLKLEIDKAQ